MWVLVSVAGLPGPVPRGGGMVGFWLGDLEGADGVTEPHPVDGGDGRGGIVGCTQGQQQRDEVVRGGVGDGRAGASGLVVGERVDVTSIHGV